MGEKIAPARIWATPTRETFEKPEWDRGEFYEDERHADGLGVQYVRADVADKLAEALKALLDANDAVQIALCDGPDVPGFEPGELGRAQVRVSEAEAIARAALASLQTQEEGQP